MYLFRTKATPVDTLRKQSRIYQEFRTDLLKVRESRCICCEHQFTDINLLQLNCFRLHHARRLDPTNAIAICDPCMFEFFRHYNTNSYTEQNFRDFHIYLHKTQQI